MIRINKYLSICGVTSRRGADVMISDGQVTVNGITVEKPGVMVDETRDVVMVGGIEVHPVKEQIYVALNKPRNVMTTLHDPFKRKTVRHLLKSIEQRVYPVGRLDYDAQGVLILTNDGDLAYRLAHPKYRVTRIYEVKVAGRFTAVDAAAIRKGIKLDDGKTGRAAQVSILGMNQRTSRVRLVLMEGRKREVKQLCAKVGHAVLVLVRVEFAGITLKGLRTGQWRYLSTTEVASLRKLVSLE
ncbi:MAG: rRNA pseudouridine synthase [Candidatus Zixiibacteriota bacterium]|nr:MAG: rRNA pseudouridine synthase [candidate division Zixibacteria bacterium]